jgi:hypothetical protein
LKGGWTGQIGSRFSGGLSATRAQTLNNPADTRIYTRNLNTVDNISLNGNWWVDSRWHMLFGVSNGHTSNSINTINYQGSHSGTNEWGLKYDPADGNSIELIARNFNQAADAAAQTDTNFTEKQLEFRTTWQITGKSALSGNLMNINHRYYHYAQRDYNGGQGGINYSLDISGKTLLKMSLQRSLINWWDTYSSYYVADNVSISPGWQISSKTVMHMAISRGINNYRGPVVPGAIARKDVIQSVMLGMDWTPQRAVTFSASVQHDKRTSTPAGYTGFGFDDNTASLSVQAYF